MSDELSDQEIEDLMSENGVETQTEVEAVLTEDEPQKENIVQLPAAELSRLMDRLDTLEIQVSSGHKHSPRDESTSGRRFSENDIDEFLSRTPPIDEFLSFNPFFQKCIWPGNKRRNDHGDLVTVPPLMLGFNMWNGPGSEFKNPMHPDRPTINVGRFQLHWEPLICVTDKDIEELELDPNTRAQGGFADSTGEPAYPIKKVILKLIQDPECGTVFMTGEDFQAMCEKWYASARFQEEKDAELRAKLDQLRDGRIKTGNIPSALLS